MTIDSAARLLYAYKPLIEGEGDDWKPLTFEEARDRFPDKVAECRWLARQVAEEVGKP